MVLDKMHAYIICPNPAMDIQAEIDAFVPGQPTRMKSESYFPGGKGIHVAMALSELGIPTMLSGVWGDENGEQLQKRTKDFYPEIKISGPFVNGWNRSCYSFLSNNEWKDTELLGVGPRVEPDLYEKFIEEIATHLESISSVAICGSWPSGASSHSSKMIVDYCNENGIPVFLDTTGPQLDFALESVPYMVHLNRHEVCQLYKKEFEKSVSLLGEQCQYAAVTDGKEGLFLNTKDNIVHANVKLDQKVISTIGSGDCLLAGLIYGHYNGLDDVGMAKMGVACGAANCIRQDLGMLNSIDVDRLNKLSYIA